ncbi:DegT/DnrJ/EryC1/StrS family aminotransferase [Streptomycetaceae bacterium NBC_01309]
MSDVIPLGRPSLGEVELAAVAEVFRSGWAAGQGPAGRDFESRFAQLVDDRDVVAVSSGTAALHLALEVLGVGTGDEVVVADYGFPAAASLVARTGATPVFADVLAGTGLVDPRAVDALVGPRTVGIVAVDVGGLPADYAELTAVADRYGLFLVEDAACAAGATYRGAPAGALAPVACFSFHGRKGVTCGEGGALVAADAKVAARARRLSGFGLEPALARSGMLSAVPVFAEPGLNLKMSDIAAAIMSAQLGRLPGLLERRTQIAARYAGLLADAEQLTCPDVPDDRTHAWQTYAVTLAPSVDRDAVATTLRRHGVQCSFAHYAAHRQPAFNGRSACPVSADLHRRQLALPMHADLSTDQVERVCDALRATLAAAPAKSSTSRK